MLYDPVAMLDEERLLPILDMLAERAREFTHVCDDVLKGENALQARDGKLPDQWQTICVISGFINYIAERNRCRYGHFAFDIDPKNTPQRRKDAQCTLDRMGMFWNQDEDDIIGVLPNDQREERATMISKFLENDRKIKEHLKRQPVVYAEDVSRAEVRHWMMRLQVLGDVEKRIIDDWNEMVARHRTPAGSSAQGVVTNV